MIEKKNTPSAFYKYGSVYSGVEELRRALDTEDGLKSINEYSLANLFQAQATFSNRHNFNDPFDIQLHFEVPSRKEIKKFLSELNAKERHLARGFFDGRKGQENLQNWKKRILETFDAYVFYCVTTKPDNNLMWSHYGNSHKGFCIEWDKSYLNGEKVNYSDKLATFHLIDLIRSDYGLHGDRKTVGKQITDAMLVKLEEWDYEDEYRIQAGKGMDKHIMYKSSALTVYRYDPTKIKAIIFGARMSPEVRSFIRDNYPYDVEYKEALLDMRKGSIEIYPC